MNTLESIVLPLPESRALAEAGIVLDTALVWVYVKDANGRIVLTVMYAGGSMCGVRTVLGEYEVTQAPTDLLAAYALLLEVAK